MNMLKHLLVSFAVLLLLFYGVDCLFAHIISSCQFNSSTGHNGVYLEQYYYNKILIGQYNSTLGKFTGNTQEAQKIADTFNKDPVIMAQQRRISEHCQTHIPRLCDVLMKPIEPYVKLRLVEAASSKHPGVLVCSVYDFYPKHIRVTWLKNGKEMPFAITSSKKMSNGNWLYQVHSQLEFTPRSGEKVTCMVEHASLMEPKLYDWDPLSGEERNKMAVGTAGLLLGLVLLSIGLIFNKGKTAGLNRQQMRENREAVRTHEDSD